MRRVMSRLVVFLLLGAAVNVAVAWGCALWLPGGGVSDNKWSRDELAPERADRFPGRWAASGVDWRSAKTSMRTSGPGWEISCFFCSRTADAFAPGVSVQLLRTGWPGYSAECASTVDYSLVRARYEADWRCAIVAPTLLRPRTRPSFRGDNVPVLIPVRPIWSGVALNTMVYGAGCWALVGGPFVLRRWRRVRLGRCVMCGYPVRGLAACPECGKRLDQATAGGGRGA